MRSKRRLEAILVAGDTICMLLGYSLPLVFWFSESGPRTGLTGSGQALLLALAGTWLIGLQGLWSSRVTAVRVLEISRLTRAITVLSIIALVADRKSSVDIRVLGLFAAATAGWSALVAWRSIYRAWLGAQHRRGRYLSRVILVGTDRRAADLARLFAIHPELGMRVVVVVGNHGDAVAHGLGDLWAGDTLDAAEVLGATTAELVVLCSADLDPALVHSLTTREGLRHRPVFVDPGLSRVDLRRMTGTSIGHQPLLQLEPATLSRVERVIKRAFDLVVGAVVTAVFAPVMLAVAVAIKLEDGGSVLFTQTRVGRNGNLFRMVKFRSMHTGAEGRLAELRDRNQRKSVLFKMSDDDDPRITRVGKIIRKLSLDEIPQVFNVFTGTMSIVGPRPALPTEVEQFPAELLGRHAMRPGITGLWQAEARDNAHFDAYQRLDLFYVENWSLLMDIVILLATAEHFVLRPLFRAARNEPTGDDAPANHRVEELA